MGLLNSSLQCNQSASPGVVKNRPHHGRAVSTLFPGSDVRLESVPQAAVPSGSMSTALMSYQHGLLSTVSVKESSRMRIVLFAGAIFTLCGLPSTAVSRLPGVLNHSLTFQVPVFRSKNTKMDPTLIIHHMFTGLALLIMALRLICRRIFFSQTDIGDYCTVVAMLCAAARGGMIHVVLSWGTNNISPQARTRIDFTPAEIYRRTVGSKLAISNRPIYNT
jgi:hypothetical protein